MSNFGSVLKNWRQMQRFGGFLHLNNQDRRQDETGQSTPDLWAELVEKCRKGDGKAQKKLFDLLSPKMFAVCLRYMGSRDAAEDVLQDGFVTLFSKLDSYAGDGSFEGWSRKVFINTALMELRRKDTLKMGVGLEEVSGMAGGGATQIQNIGYKELMKLVMSLPAGYRTVFNMAVIEGYSHHEIAPELGISEATSRSQLQRARKILQEKIRNM